MSDQKFYSDHNGILFSVNLAVGVPYPFRDPRRIDWRKVGHVIKYKLSDARNGNIGVAGELGSMFGALEKVFEIAFKVSCPAKHSERTM